MKQIVIDASVARAASEKIHPTSTACRETLEAMVEAKHQLVMCEELHQEWQTHKSPYTHRWLYRMFARKRIKRLTQIDETLYPLILKQVNPQSIKEDAIQKDLHLIGAAITTDNRIIALDEKMHHFMSLACENVAPLQHIMWLHPVEHNASEWLMSDAPDKKEHHLC